MTVSQNCSFACSSKNVFFHSVPFGAMYTLLCAARVCAVLSQVCEPTVTET